MNTLNTLSINTAKLGKKGRKPKYIHSIILQGLNAREIYKEYKQNVKTDAINSSIPTIIEYSKNNTEEQHVTELLPKVKTHIYYNPNDNKTVTMRDYISFSCLPERTDLCCFHDRHQFNSSPIGIPIKYVPKVRDKKIPLDQPETGTNDYFLTYGVTCSFNCALAFIKDHQHEHIYRNSKNLLYSMYYKIYNTSLNVNPAPSWENLKEYGGHLNIEQLREAFCNCKYIITPNIKRPYMVSVGKYIEQSKCGFI